MSDTKQKILDAAEHLIAEQGYAGTSLRQIIGEAKVNLAAVHYHFGSKEDLLDAVVTRKVTPVNQQRLERLEKLMARGKAPAVEKVLDAFLAPMAEAAERNPQFVRTMGRLAAEGMLPGVIDRNFREVLGRFAAALRQAVPGLPEEEFQWRMQFTQGALAHTMCGAPQGDFQKRVKLLARFLSGGFLAPPAEAS